VSKSRASIFDDGQELDIGSFAPKSAIDTKAPPADQVKAVSETAQFRSREPAAKAPAPPKRQRRQYRTGRNVQFNLKASAKTVESFYALCDKTGWVLGETLEHAVAALEKELKANSFAPTRRR
jgi:hypothetical protein